jgi:PIN domain nuclease of toxin-antitoxin system
MRLLLDTHAVLWWRTDSQRLGREARQAIAGAETVWVSAVSGWEVAIKRALGKLQFAGSFIDLVNAGDFSELPLSLRHAERLTGLAPHHADPFDRMLIAQALVEGLTIVTHDRQFSRYEAAIVWA